ncbi:nuclear transport factor 2 family protein [Halomonas sp. QHL1]|uniref:nuclear transport factor 2 family protein n=1 Tax=Halomonas sp. QHL1 TaxID=1123773 RepID=UPI0008FD6C0A|nr:nuclear transport factor 2 family protein [Halomonas sp. QHL1]OJA04809.1 hypothetical protein QHL1GM_05080 [Halomonas sp. QHL1]
MGSLADKAAIEELLAKLTRAHADHDIDSIMEVYAPEARIFDLAPPLGRHGMNRSRLVAWLATWDGPIRIDAKDIELRIDGHLAHFSALNRISGFQSSEAQDIWFRSTMALQKLNESWKIICHHSSVPFYMDGSYSAAVDLTPSLF